MSEFTSLTGQLLVSLPPMKGDYFSQSVTLLIEHNRNGAFGLVINKPMEVHLDDLLIDQLSHCPAEITVLDSGPVEQDRLFILHSIDKMFDDSVTIAKNVALSTSLDSVEAMYRQEGPNAILAGLGYAGWSGGQLEEEISADVWLVVPYFEEVIFKTPFEQRATRAAHSLGIDLNLISPTPGHG